jgi:hypothetical protein
MTGQKRFLSVGLAAALAAAGGTAWAMTEDGDSARPEVPAPTSGELTQGPAPSGGRYTISRIDPAQLQHDATKWFCTEIATPAAGTRGCDPIPDANGRVDGQPLRPSYALLATDRFFTAIAPTGVTAMEVRIKGEDNGTASQSIDAGAAGKLLIVVVGGPVVTSRDPASSRDYEVRLLGANGETVGEAVISDPPLD